MEEPKNNSSMFAGVLAVVLVLLTASWGVFKYLKNDTSQTVTIENPTGSTVPTQTTPTEVVVQTSYLYKDGEYSADGAYVSPGGAEQINIELTIKDDVITDAVAVLKATRPNSVKFQQIFINNFRSLIVGKKLDEVKLDKVSGSSLTPKGFNDAVAKIKAQAQA